jgi:hypothetical protein
MALNVWEQETMHTLSPGYYEGKTLINKQYKVQNVDWHDSRFMVRQVENLHMKETSQANLNFIHRTSVTWR